MRWAIVPMSVAAAACNAIFGIKDTKAVDAAYFDSPIDAPFACPAIGSNLEMSGVLHQEFQQNCLSYHFSLAGFAVGLCPVDRAGSGIETFAIAAGTVGGGPLGPVPSLPDRYTSTATYYDEYQSAAPSPDGTHIYAMLMHYDYNPGATSYSVKRFTRQADSSWQLTDSIPLASAFATISTVFSGPTGDRFLYADGGTAMVSEWYEDGSGGWAQSAARSYSTLGVTSLGGMSVTSDGRRMAFETFLIGQQYVQPLYTDRASEADWFRPAVVVPGAPNASDVQLTDDCARVYVTGLGSVVSVQQR